MTQKNCSDFSDRAYDHTKEGINNLFQSFELHSISPETIDTITEHALRVKITLNTLSNDYDVAELGEEEVERRTTNLFQSPQKILSHILVELESNSGNIEISDEAVEKNIQKLNIGLNHLGTPTTTNNNPLAIIETMHEAKNVLSDNETKDDFQENFARNTGIAVGYLLANASKERKNYPMIDFNPKQSVINLADGKQRKINGKECFDTHCGKLIDIDGEIYGKYVASYHESENKYICLGTKDEKKSEWFECPKGHMLTSEELKKMTKKIK